MSMTTDALFSSLCDRPGVDLFTTDVFDTLLIRNSRSERERIQLAESAFARRLSELGLSIPADRLIEARLQAQALAFRALSISGRSGEVRLPDLIERQLRILGLPAHLVAERCQLELDVEKLSLAPNLALATALRAVRGRGKRVVAISDTTLPTADVAELIRHFHGDGLVDAIYSSADLGLTKRHGDIFGAVAAAEHVSCGSMLHIGDDHHADVRVPSSLGLQTMHVPRPKALQAIRRIKGGLSEGARAARAIALRPEIIQPYATRLSFGHQVLGPIVAQFCQRLWLYVSAAEAAHNPVVLFCARGGVGIRSAFETFVDRIGLPLAARRETLMVSRLVAARAALLCQGRAAMDELTREFGGETHAAVATALGGRDYVLSDAWNEPFKALEFIQLLFAQRGADVLADIREQQSLFDRHFRALIGEANRVILCDTGLYGSTLRMLMSAYPSLSLESVQFARSNYKGQSEEHFLKVAGLVVERNRYSPFAIESCVLRYWHLVESTFEPAVASVRMFDQTDDGRIIGNCGDIAYQSIDPTAANELLAGVLEYLRGLPRDAGLVIPKDARTAWPRLKRAITQPSAVDLKILNIGARSVDFGRTAFVMVTSKSATRSISTRLRAMRGQLWREGAIAGEFPVLKHALLPLLGLIQTARGLLHKSSC